MKERKDRRDTEKIFTLQVQIRLDDFVPRCKNRFRDRFLKCVTNWAHIQKINIIYLEITLDTIMPSIEIMLYKKERKRETGKDRAMILYELLLSGSSRSLDSYYLPLSLKH